MPYISKLGKTPEEILNNSWNKNDFNGLYDRFGNLENMLIQHSERHLAYPILHYFHSNVREYSAPLMLAVLDEAITIQEIYRIDQDSNSFHWNVMRGVLDDYIIRLDETFIGSAKDAPEFPYKNIPKFKQLSKAELDNRLQDSNRRRCILLGLIHKDGWEWQDVTGN